MFPVCILDVEFGIVWLCMALRYHPIILLRRLLSHERSTLCLTSSECYVESTIEFRVLKLEFRAVTE